MIILASTSPRRQALLKEVVSEFKSVQPSFDEFHLKHLSPELQVQHLAVNKALSVESNTDDIIISGDTIVEFNNELLEKPMNELDAFNMLQKLNGKAHRVLSALCVMGKNKTLIKTFVSEVHLKKVSDETLKEYIKIHEPLDKAGSYGIQDAYFKHNILESYTGYLNTIIGFPIEALSEMLKEVDE